MKPETKRMLAIAGKNMPLILAIEMVCAGAAVISSGGNVTGGHVAVAGAISAIELMSLYGGIYVLGKGKNPFKTVAELYDLVVAKTKKDYQK